MYCLTPASTAPQSTQKLITDKWKLQQKALLDKRLTKIDSLVLNYLLEKFNRTYQNTLAGYARMAKDLDCGIRKAKEAVDKLISFGYIKKTYQGGRERPGGRRLANKYTFHFEQVERWTPGWCDPVKEEPQEARIMLPDPGVHDRTPLIVKIVSKRAPLGGKTVSGWTPPPIFLKTPIYQDITTPPATHQEDRCCRQSPSPQKELSAEEQEFIDLEVSRADKAGDIRKTTGAYRAGLERKALAGELDISELDNLRRQKRAEELSKINLNMDEAQAKELIQQALSGQVVTIEHINLTPAEALQKLSNSFPTLYARIHDQQASQQKETETTESHIQALVDADHQPQKICEDYVWGRLDLGASNLVEDVLKSKFPAAFNHARKIRELYRQCLLHRKGAKAGNSFLMKRFEQKFEQLQALAPVLAQQIVSS